jgi:predicted NBD/HSP70 family sugar kinase
MVTEDQPVKARRAKRVTRDIHVRLVVEAIRALGPSSQADISRKTGLSRAAVNSIVQDLRETGVVEMDWTNGRETKVMLAPVHGAVATIELEPEAVSGTLYSFAGQQRFRMRLDQGGPAGPEELMTLLRQLTAAAGLEAGDLSGIALSLQAPVDAQAGVILGPALRRYPLWKDLAPAAWLAGQVGVPVILENDANLAALAEWAWGAGRGASDFLSLTCATGIGGGLVVAGAIYRGATGLAGEIGHMILDQSGPLCSCGSRGCLMGFASERAILLALADDELPPQSLTEVIARARDGDAACRRVLFEVGRYLGRAIANVVRVTGTRLIAVGGALSEAGDLLFNGLLHSVDILNLKAIAPGLEIVPARLGEDAVALGGVAALLDHLGQGLSALPAWMEHR